MADELRLTPSPVRVTDTASAQTQKLEGALDVSDYDEIVFLLGVPGIYGTSPSASISIETGMDNTSEDGWVTLVTFTAVTASDTWEKKKVDELLRFVRWKCTLSGTGSPQVTFVITGMARSWS